MRTNLLRLQLQQLYIGAQLKMANASCNKSNKLQPNAKKGSPSGYCRVANKPIPALTMYKSNNELQSTDLKKSKFVRLQ